MEIPHLHAFFGQKVSQIFRHFLGERRHQHAFALLYSFRNFRQKIVHLCRCRPDFNRRINQACRTHDLLDHLPLTAFEFVFRRRCRHENRLTHFGLELIKPQRPVVERRGQSEPVANQRFLSRTVTAVHAAELSHHHVAFIKEHQRISGQIVNEAGRRGPGSKPSQVAGIVFDSFAEPHLIEHFQIEIGALLQALRFYEEIVL